MYYKAWQQHKNYAFLVCKVLLQQQVTGTIISDVSKTPGLEYTVEIVIETPKGSQNKYTWDEERKVIRFKKCMPLGFHFPFDFGMVPGTRAEDGDPVDVLLLMDAAVHAGSFMQVRMVGALKANQKRKTSNRNDRLIAIEQTCPVYGHYKDLDDIDSGLRNQIEAFFRSYNEVQGKEFTALGWANAAETMQLIETARL